MTFIQPRAFSAWLALTLFCFSLHGTVAHALTASPAALRIEDKKSGNVMLGAEEAAIEAGEVYRTVLLLWGKLDIYGNADEVVVLSGHVVFHPGSKLSKSLVVMGGSYETLPGASVAVDSVSFQSPGPLWRLLLSATNVWRENFTGIMLMAGSAIFCLLFWLFAYILFRSFPALERATAGRMLPEWPMNIFAGLIAMLVVPMLFALLLISIFGIILLPLYFILLLMGAAISYAVAVLWAGQRLLPEKYSSRGTGLSLLVGIGALQLFWMASAWWTVLPVFFIWLLAWGALVRSARALWK